ncbi:hypothetical protein AB0O90_14430 [Microbacterium testaceum]|uniref:hypothetical protein n=1 Tax=Microbacterium testaceum TaxID=2033 RepID=UPI003441CB24
MERHLQGLSARLTATWLVSGNQRTPVWEILTDHDRGDGGRALRVALWRLHYEATSLTELLRLLDAHDPAALNLTAIESAIDSITRRLKDGRGAGGVTLLAIARAIEQFDSSEIATRLTALRQESRGAARRLERLLELSILDRAASMAAASAVPLTIRLERNKTVGDKISISGSNNSFANRSKGATVVTLNGVTLSSPEVLQELENLLANPEITAHPVAREVGAQLLEEVQGERRLDHARTFWSKLKDVSPVIGTVLAGASLLNNLLGG